MNKVAFVIWLEDLFSPILRTQVLDVLAKISEKSAGAKIQIVAFQSICAIFSSYPALRKLRKKLKKSEIELVIVPCFTTLNISWFFARWWLLPFIFGQIFPALLLLTVIKRIRVLHCRSYQSVFPAILIKKMRKIKVIFDPRSPFPEETAWVNRLPFSSLTYKVWKGLERFYLSNADVTVVAAKSFIRNFPVTSKFNFEVIPNNVDTMRFKRDENFRVSFRKKSEIPDDEIVFVYCGTLSSRWNNPRVYAEFVIKSRAFGLKSRFLFVTPDVEKLKDVFQREGVRRDEYLAVSAALEEVPKYLSAADIGLNLMEKKDVRMSVKTAEYLSMGLPVIANSNVAGAKEIIQRYGVGWILQDKVDARNFESILRNGKDVFFRCRKLAREEFSTEKVANRYLNLYVCLAGSSKRSVI